MMPNSYIALFTACCGICQIRQHNDINPLEHSLYIGKLLDEAYMDDYSRILFHVSETEKDPWREALKKKGYKTEFIKTKTGFLGIVLFYSGEE